MKLHHLLPFVILLAAGCQHPPEPQATGQSSFVFVNPPPAGPSPEPKGEVVEPASRSNYFEAQLREPAVLPAYPAGARKARVKTYVVGVRITVDPTGRVSGVRPSMFVISTPGPFASEFRDAVETAVRQWQFVPARAEYFDIVHEGTATYQRTTHVEQVETEFDLSFTFTTEGKVQTGTAKAR